MSKKSRIVEAVGVSANALNPAGRPLAGAIQAAMTAAAQHARRVDKITDPAEIRARMLAARAAVKRGDWEPPAAPDGD
jgi:hypothetical protein